jgi:integrase
MVNGNKNIDDNNVQIPSYSTTPSTPRSTLSSSSSSYHLQITSEEYYRNFKNSCKTKATFESYNNKLNKYMKYKGYTEYSQLVDPNKDVRLIESDIIDFIVYLKEKHYRYQSRCAYLNAICHFYNVNDEIAIRRKKISRFLGSEDGDQENMMAVMGRSEPRTEGLVEETGGGSITDDKPYTTEQISKLLEVSDERTKVMVLLMASAGLRLGGLLGLKVGHLIKIPEYSNYQITVYANSKKSRYQTFCTSECATAIDNYLDFRKRCGERITDKSPLLRQEFNRDDELKAANKVLSLGKSGIKRCISKILYESGLRTHLIEKDERNLNQRREVAMAHGFRKFFDTTCTLNGMNPIYVERCMGHDLKGVKDSYFIPRADKNGIYRDILEGNDRNLGYVSVMNSLTINQEHRLKTENLKLKAETSKIDELQSQLNKLQTDQKESKDYISSLLSGMYGMLHKSKNPSKEIEEIVGEFIELDPSKY